MISVDDHVTEPKNAWTSRIRAADRERAPHVVEEGGEEYWVYGKKRKHVREQGVRLFTPGTGKRDLVDFPSRYSEMRPGCYIPQERLADMDMGEILASVSFPSFPRFCGQEFYEAPDRELAFACVKAYNDWMLDEWCGTDAERLIPMIILPLWDPALAATEIERCAGKGAKALAFSENPRLLGLPSIHSKDEYWHPVWAAANEADLAICIHIGSSSRLPQTSPDAPFTVGSTIACTAAQGTLADWLFSGLFVRYPRLRVCLSEGGIGWMPYILERAEHAYQRHGEQALAGVRHLGHSGVTVEDGYFDTRVYERSPMEWFRDHIFGCFIEDSHGVRSLREIGLSNVMAETDYPHGDTGWPHSTEMVRNQLAKIGLSAEEEYSVLQGNARRVFRLGGEGAH